LPGKAAAQIFFRSKSTDLAAAVAANPHGDPGFWKPAPLLDRLAAEGKRFN